MIRQTVFSITSRGSLATLLGRAVYLPSTEHTNHLGKVIHPVGVYHCTGDSVLDFLSTVLESLDRYLEARKGKKGNCTRKLLEEFIQSFDEGADLSAEERKFTKEQFIEKMFRHVPLMVGEHEDTILERVDLHFVVGGYTNHQPPRVFTTDGFGHGGKNILLEMERVEAAILKVINAKRPPERQILSAREKKKLLMKKKGIKSLGQKLAGNWNGRRATLRRALLQLGYYVRKMTAETVTVARNAWSRGRRYLIETLNQERLRELEVTAVVPPRPAASKQEVVEEVEEKLSTKLAPTPIAPAPTPAKSLPEPVVAAKKPSRLKQAQLDGPSL